VPARCAAAAALRGAVRAHMAGAGRGRRFLTGDDSDGLTSARAHGRPRAGGVRGLAYRLTIEEPARPAPLPPLQLRGLNWTSRAAQACRQRPPLILRCLERGRYLDAHGATVGPTRPIGWRWWSRPAAPQARVALTVSAGCRRSSGPRQGANRPSTRSLACCYLAASALIGCGPRARPPRQAGGRRDPDRRGGLRRRSGAGLR
jgi:hypothetical protein